MAAFSASELRADQLMPHSTESEDAVLGSILIDPDLHRQIARMLQPSDFFIVRNAWIMEAMNALAERGDPIDVLTVTTELEQRSQLADIGGAAYVLSLVHKTPSTLNAEGYALIVKRLAWRRGLLQYAGEVARLAHSDETDIRKIYDSVVDALGRIGGGGMLPDTHTARELADSYIEALSDAVRAGIKRVGIPTGFTILDRLFDGMYRPGQLIVLGAYTNQGKTQAAIELALNTARQGYPVVYVSLESAPETIFNRMVAAHTGIPAKRLDEADLRDDEMTRVIIAASELSELPLDIVVLESVQDIERHLHDMSFRYDMQPGMVFLDDLDTLAETAKGTNDYERLKRVSNAALKIPLHTGWGVVALKQLRIPTNVQGETNSATLLEKLSPTIASFEGGRTIAQKGGVLITMLSADWIREKVYSGFKSLQLQEGYIYFRRLKMRDRVSGVIEVPLRFDAKIPKLVDVKVTQVDTNGGLE